MNERRRAEDTQARIEVKEPRITVQNGRPIHRWGPVLAYLIVVSVLAFNLKLQADTLDQIQRTAMENSEKAELSACEVLDHRVSSRLSFISIIVTLKGIALAAADEGDTRFRNAAKGIVVPASPSPDLIAARDKVCKEAGLEPEPALPEDMVGAMRLISFTKPQRCLGKRATQVGTPQPDFLIGTGSPDVIHGRGGPDTVFGLERNDRLCGGKGADSLNGGPDFDRAHGGGGEDICDAERKRKCERS